MYKTFNAEEVRGVTYIDTNKQITMWVPTGTYKIDDKLHDIQIVERGSVKTVWAARLSRVNPNTFVEHFYFVHPSKVGM